MSTRNRNKRIDGVGEETPSVKLRAIPSNQYQMSATYPTTSTDTSESVEFTREEVDAPLSEKIKGQIVQETNLMEEQEKLQNTLSASEQKCPENDSFVQRVENFMSTLIDDAFASLKRERELNQDLQEIVPADQKIDLATANTTLQRLEKEKSAIVENLVTPKGHNASLQEQLTSPRIADVSVTATRSEFEEQRHEIRALKDRLHAAERQINEKEMLRRKLQNTILELKGNIRVFCRVRPLLPEDGCALELPVVSYPTSIEGHEQCIELMKTGENYLFTFDRVFSHEASQTDVFGEISELVQSALDGYKVCIFTCGQTGSGKTYTMMGRPDSSDQKGLIPRSLEQIFETTQRLSAQGWKYKLQASVLEIYNETIRDLLSSNRSRPGKQYAITQEANGNTRVSDLTIVDVCTSKEVAFLLRQAAQCRSVGKTQMNEQSSRSHFVFTLKISAVNEATEKHGVLNLIDLAGSERLSRSGSTGDQLKETLAINKSLSSLTDVMYALAKKEKNHIPFRNSKLTHLLQDSLSGDSKTLMFVNLSPEPSSVEETLSSLRFAAGVNNCQTGIPRRQLDPRALAKTPNPDLRSQPSPSRGVFMQKQDSKKRKGF